MFGFVAIINNNKSRLRGRPDLLDLDYTDIKRSEFNDDLSISDIEGRGLRIADLSESRKRYYQAAFDGYISDSEASTDLVILNALLFAKNVIKCC